MRQVSKNNDIPPVSRLFACFLGVLFGLAISQPVRAQGKAEPQSPCVPSDLNALIVSAGKTLQVHENREQSNGKGSASDMATLSSYALSGLDEQQRKRAYKVFSKQARQSNAAAMTNLAVASMAGWGGRPDTGAALYWLNAAADRRYGPAFYDLGILYFKACGVRQDLAEAFRFFELGAKGGYAAAQVNLGYFYDHGLGVAQDQAAAAHWYLLAAESGEAQAQYNLGDLYLHGEGIPRDESIAFTWFQKAALQGHTGARIMVGSMLAAGRGTSKDLAGAYFWILGSVLQGDPRGVPLLRTLEHQLPGAEIEEAKARAKLLQGGLQASKNR